MTRRIVQAAQDGPRVLILTTFEHDEYGFGALRAAASGFLLKRSSPEVSGIRSSLPPGHRR